MKSVYSQYVILLALTVIVTFTMTEYAYASPYALQNPTGTVNATNPQSIGSGQSSGAITVRTDKTSYNNGDTLTISGTTQDYISGTPVTVIIIDPTGNIMKADQVNLQSDRTYAISHSPSDLHWNGAGVYTVKVQFGSPDRTAYTTIQFVGVSSTPTPTPPPIPTPPSVRVKTDLLSYKLGDTIVITGHVSNLQSSTAITIRVFNPSQMLMAVRQLVPSIDGSFTQPINAVLPLWSDSGEYVVDAQYGLTANANTTFNYVGQTVPVPTPTPPTPEPTPTPAIPHWVKSLFGLYAQGQVSDSDLISALQFLIKAGVIKVS